MDYVGQLAVGHKRDPSVDGGVAYNGSGLAAVISLVGARRPVLRVLGKPHTGFKGCCRAGVTGIGSKTRQVRSTSSGLAISL